MKRSELERKLKQLGWRLLKHGSRHDVWSNGRAADKAIEYIPRHPKVAEGTARAILRTARTSPGKTR